MTDRPAEDLPRMTIGQHLTELRSRLIKSIVIFCVTFGVALYFQEELMRIMVQPHAWAMQRVSESHGPGSAQVKLITLKYQESFMAYMKVAFVAASFAASPFIAYQVWAFVAAGLYHGERTWVYIFAPFSLIMFVGGALFGYFIMIRYGLGFMATYGDPTLIGANLDLSMYLSLVITLTIVAGVVFELPLVMLFLSKIGLVEPKAWHKLRRYMIVAIFVLAGILTPPDVVSQLLMAAPMLVLYEFGVLLSFMTAKKAP